MDHSTTHVDFALIGHQDSWDKIERFVQFLSPRKQMLTKKKLAEVYGYIPPRKIFDINVNSATGQSINGCYIETFISPAELGMRHWKSNVLKVKEAAKCAKQSGAGIAGLGGFTSIVLEGRDNSLNEDSTTKFTTGNTLTAAFIGKAIEKACLHFSKPLIEQKLLVIGATGDIGSACVAYFKDKVQELLLCARQPKPLDDLCVGLTMDGYATKASTCVSELLPEADIIIAIASSAIENFDASICKPGIIVCDAGYPKNLVYSFDYSDGSQLFCGGMGQVQGGFTFSPSIHRELYDFPLENIAHGCLLEAIILALEKRFIPYSTGKGNITVEKMEWIYKAAKKHGITEAPFFNPLQAWPQKNLYEQTHQRPGTTVEPNIYC